MVRHFKLTILTRTTSECSAALQLVSLARNFFVLGSCQHVSTVLSTMGIHTCNASILAALRVHTPLPFQDLLAFLTMFYVPSRLASGGSYCLVSSTSIFSIVNCSYVAISIQTVQSIASVSGCSVWANSTTN